MKNFIKYLSMLLIISSVQSCIEAPVLHQENTIFISKENVEKVCEVVENTFNDFSCKKYMNNTYKNESKEEEISIELSQKRMILIYDTEKKNSDLYKTYEHLIDELQQKEE